MAKFGCFSALVGKKKRSKNEKKALGSCRGKKQEESGNVQVKLVKDADTTGFNSPLFSILVPIGKEKNSGSRGKVMSDESVGGAEATEVAYEGGDEGDEELSIKRECSDFDLQSQVTNKGEGEEKSSSAIMKVASYNSINEINEQSGIESEREAELDSELPHNGHVSDPGIQRVEFWASPMLKRSCSNLETTDMDKKKARQLSLSVSHSYEDLQNSALNGRGDFARSRGSPASNMTPCSADQVMLKKHSSSQVLPSRSRKLWWKLFLWSHRNLHNAKTSKPILLAIDHSSNQRGGYCSDTLEPSRPTVSSKLKSPGSFSEESQKDNKQDWSKFNGEASDFFLQNQWVAFSTESSSLTRVDEWVNNLAVQPQLLNEEESGDEDIVYPPSPDAGPSSVAAQVNRRHNNISDEVVHANNVIQSLNASSNVAHIAAMNLRVIPTMSHFSSLRSVNLSGNMIVRITPGSLPKGLHTLNLSKNKIVAIEGLRELTRLRVLDLSYNKISRIGHGLSKCTLIKELYLAGNKISDLDGLHKLLKLTVLDLSFNKVITAKALGQLVANYNSLLALNLLGNPIQSNIGDDQLRKVVTGILPQLAYLNKQPIKPQRAREVVTDSVAKAALGNNGRTSRKKAPRRVAQGGSSRSRPSGGQRSKHIPKGSNLSSPLRWRSPAIASSSH